MKKAIIMDIQRYSIHDGPGIRTTVFMKGCNMACRWCHNPESQHMEPEMMFYSECCIGCKSCISLCKMDAHRFEGGKHIIDLDKCMGCECINNCGKICPTEAMRQCGIEMDSKEVLEKVLADKLFYGIDGGVTCSGGEPLLQEEFLMEFLPMCKDEGISTCIDTALNVEWEKVEKILPWVDIFLVDLKFMDNDSHMHYTGKGAAYVIDNLHRLSDKQKPVIIRMPLAANVNDSEKEIKQRRRLLNELSNVKRIDIFAVSDHAATKYKSLQREFVSFNKDVDKEIMINNMRKGLEQLNGSDNI